MFAFFTVKKKALVSISVCAAFSLGTIACSPAKSSVSVAKPSENQATEHKTNTEQPSNDLTASVQHTQVKVEQKVKPIFGKRMVTFNGEKFEYQGGSIHQGTKLFNLAMASTGFVKGSFVVVTKPETTLNLVPVAVKSQQKIAKDTYRIVPVKGKRLEPIYRLLLANDNLSRVELEIDYSAKSKDAAF